jgi:hypothetical protein
MTGIAHGIGAPTSYVGQTFPATSPFGAYAFGPQPFVPQAQQYVQPLQQQQVLQQLLQIVPQQLQQLLHIVPQQLNQLQNVQQQVQHLQQLLQILPQQLHQLQQLVQSLPHQLLHQQFSGAPQPFGTIQSPNVAAFGGGLSQQAAGPWGFTAAGQGVQPPGYPQTAGIMPQNFGWAQPSQLM